MKLAISGVTLLGPPLTIAFGSPRGTWHDPEADSLEQTEAGMSRAVPVKNIALSLLGVAFVWFFAVSLPFHIGGWDSGPFPLPMGAISLVGWVPMILGGCVIIWCYCLFILVGRGTPWPFYSPKRLVIVGPYRFVRNPMQVGFILIVLGEAVLFRSILLIFYALIGLGVLHIGEVLVEGPALRRRFGTSYERYRKSVPLWIPRLSPYREEG